MNIEAEAKKDSSMLENNKVTYPRMILHSLDGVMGVFESDVCIIILSSSQIKHH